MRIGIIGAGHIGGTLTRRLTALGHEVRVANSRAPETLSELAAETGATAVWAADAADDADLVIVSIPQKNVPDLAPGIVTNRKPGAPVIETNNYYPQQRDGLIAEIEAGTAGERVGVAAARVPVIKAFNGIFWKHLGDRGTPAGSPGRIALPDRRCRRPGQAGGVRPRSTSSASTPSTADRSSSPGASSPARRCTARTTTSNTRWPPSPRHRSSGPPSSARDGAERALIGSGPVDTAAPWGAWAFAR